LTIEPPAPVGRPLVVVLNYNGIADTLACLASLRAQTCRASVLVIDNASRADDFSRLQADFPEVELLRLPRNLGWAGGNNVGLRLGLARGFDTICLLNNDTVLAPDALAELVAAAGVVDPPGLLHPMIHDFDDSARAQLDPGPVPSNPDPAMRALAARHEVVEINWAYGACLLLPASVVRAVGLLDERFFLQLEEEDYLRRAEALGMRSYCARRARVLHKESISFGGRVTPGKTYYQVRNSLLLAEKHAATPAGLFRALRRLWWALRHQARAADPRAASGPGFVRWLLSADPLARAARQGVGDYARRRFGPRRAAAGSAP
jgi:GT2 family glycosyltransferase